MRDVYDMKKSGVYSSRMAPLVDLIQIGNRDKKEEEQKDNKKETEEEKDEEKEIPNEPPQEDAKEVQKSQIQFPDWSSDESQDDANPRFLNR